MHFWLLTLCFFNMFSLSMIHCWKDSHWPWRELSCLSTCAGKKCIQFNPHTCTCIQDNVCTSCNHIQLYVCYIIMYMHNVQYNTCSGMATSYFSNILNWSWMGSNCVPMSGICLCISSNRLRLSPNWSRLSGGVVSLKGIKQVKLMKYTVHDVLVSTYILTL